MDEKNLEFPGLCQGMDYSDLAKVYKRDRQKILTPRRFSTILASEESAQALRHSGSGSADPCPGALHILVRHSDGEHGFRQRD